jgi:hypothetical protein
MKATHKERFVSIDGVLNPVKISPGQFITGRFSLHEEMYPRKKKENKSPLTVWRWLQTLEKLENLNINSYSKYSVITISNWSDYQGNEQHVNNTRTTHEQHVNTNKNVKNVENGKKKDIPKKSHGTFENVFLTEEEHQKLKDKFNGTLAERINALSEGIKSKGYKYKCHYATILSWSRRDDRKKTSAEKPITQKQQYAIELLKDMQ